MRKKIRVEIDFIGDGRVIEKRPNSFYGGVRDPRIERNIAFRVDREFLDRGGVWNPKFRSKTVKGGFQINVYGNSKGYRELARYLLAISELDIGNDPDFHNHHELMSSDKRTRLHLIVHKKIM